MRDDDLLGLLAADAPVPGPGHADEVLRRARRARMNRRATGLGAALGVLAVMGVVASGTVLSGRTPAGPAPAATTTPPSSVAPSPMPGTETQAYVKAVLTAAGRPPVLYMVDGFCDVMEPAGDCRPGLPAGLRDEIAAAVPGVRFVSGPGIGVLPIVTIGELRREGEFVDIPISIVRGGLDGEGKTYRLKLVDGHWQVTGTVGSMWIA